jgi:galactose mutarotase-like enzyme
VCEVGATLRSYNVGTTRSSTASARRVVPQRPGAGAGSLAQPAGRRPLRVQRVRAQAALDEPERRNAIHGLVRWLPWTLQTRHQNQLSLRLQLHPSPGYPFSLLLEMEYHVGRTASASPRRPTAPTTARCPSASGSTPT